jgi:glycosyltransferase involved in cell wall biosynthesis
MDSQNKLASILINNYNYAQFVGQAIESALNQTYKNIEVIVVDDGSTDNSRSIIEKFEMLMIYFSPTKLKKLFKHFKIILQLIGCFMN